MDNDFIRFFFEYLFQEGYTYRYRLDRWKYLHRLGDLPYSSPRRMVQVGGETLIEELMQPTALPRILSPREELELRLIAKIWSRFILAQEKVVRAYPQLLKEVCTPGEQQSGLVSPGYSFPLSWYRLDLVNTDEGFKVVDVNTIRSAGYGDMVLINRLLDEAFGKDVVGNAFPVGDIYIRTVWQCVAEWKESFPCIHCDVGQILTSGNTGEANNFRIMRELTERALRKTVVLLDRNSVSGEKLGCPIIIGGRVIEGDQGFAKVADLYPHGACIMPPLFRRWMGNKLWFSIPFRRQYQGIFCEFMGEYYYKLERIIPYTGSVRFGKIIFPDREYSPKGLPPGIEWVLKPASGSSGKGIYLSWRENKTKWHRLLQESATGTLQRYYPSKEKCLVLNARGECIEQELYTKYGLYIIGGEFAGVEFMTCGHPLVHGGRRTYYTTARAVPS